MRCLLEKILGWLWNYDLNLGYVSANPFVKERYERTRDEELGSLSVTE